MDEAEADGAIPEAARSALRLLDVIAIAIAVAVAAFA
jgi:hypothetical protein